MKVENESDLIYESSEVQKFYKESQVFITGGSGFLGHLLIQKLVRDCPDISKLYLLIRPKKGKNSNQRFEELFQDPVFDKMKIEQPNYMNKIELIMGDLEQPGLGINEKDRKLISQEVNIVFHLGATVRFDEHIKKATAINVRATRDLLELTKTIVNLKVFAYVSTAYSHCQRDTIDEDVYDVPISSDRLMKITETLTIPELDVLSPKLIDGWFNTYTFTKAVAESAIQEYGKGLPTVIFRPSMILSTYNDPVEAWINNFYGPVGITAASATGLLRIIQMSPNFLADLVPGDYVINCLIVTASHIGNTFKDGDEVQYLNEVPVFNYVSSNVNPLSWREYDNMCHKHGLKWQTIHAVWHPYIIMTRNEYLYKFGYFFLQLLPAYIVDFILLAMGKERRMVKINKKMKYLISLVLQFGIKTYDFKNDNTQALWKKLNKSDQRIFPFSMKDLVWNEYFVNYAKGLRLYVIKDPLDTLPVARVKVQRLKIAHYVSIALLCIFVAWISLRILQLCLF